MFYDPRTWIKLVKKFRNELEDFKDQIHFLSHFSFIENDKCQPQSSFNAKKLTNASYIKNTNTNTNYVNIAIPPMNTTAT